MTYQAPPARDFIRDIINEDLKTNKYDGRVHTRFPPEPNGYLHIGHAKSICLNFGIAEEYGGKCNLRFDDTNPTKEGDEYVQSMIDDVHWLGFDWEDRLFFASDYFDRMYEYAVQLVKAGKAYVDDLTAEEISGEKVLRAKIDMAHPNMNMRDPVIYRILKESHYRAGDKWCVYPMYDWAHGLEDSIERITHSICTLEFENHRPLYDWCLIELGVYRPQQIEFAPLNLTYTVLSKRRLLELVKGKYVDGWDDPRMPTIIGMRRRGYSPIAIRTFCKRIGVAKVNSILPIEFLEYCLREDLNKTSPRFMGVLHPLKVVIENYPEDKVEDMEAVNNPEDPAAGIRKVPFSKELYIEHEDFMEEPPKKFYRLAPGREVRLRYAYFITCKEVIKEGDKIIELRCTVDPATRGGNAPDGRKVKSTLHWVSAAHAIDAEVKLYERLFTVDDPTGQKDEDFKDFLNPNSRKVLNSCKVEPAVRELKPFDRFQFERQGYFCVDPDTTKEHLVINRTVELRDTWAKIQKQQEKQ